jgi:diguanylate cyclase (GGDEF)-like protein
LHGIPPAQMQAVFPFHIAFDRHLRVKQFGGTLPRLCPGVAVGKSADALFRILTPAGLDFDFADITGQSFTIFFVECLETKAVLKGQMLCLDDGMTGLMLFLCSPVVRDMDGVMTLGLSLNDFAIHDATVDFLVLLQTKINTINDVRKMADRLKAEVKVRREAEKELQETNTQLEQRVRDRTIELSVTNAQLQSTVRLLEQRNREISLLNKMGDMLLACRSVRETYAVIADSMLQLCPDESGQLMLLNESLEAFQVVTAWGKLEGQIGTYQKDHCWALRRTRPYHWEGDTRQICEHFPDKPAGEYTCIPLLVQGKLLGVFHMQLRQSLSQSDEPEHENYLVERRRLIATAADHIGLSIANLLLQESLRQQSIRDPLTGLFNRRHMEESLARELARARRHQKPVSLIMLDVDHFKRFNDTLGHQAGDALLAALGKLLAREVRGEDVACRYGGEEFMLILPGAPADGALRRAEAIREEIETRLQVEYDGALLPAVTSSLGVATYPRDAANAEALVNAADACLYQAKAGGRNRVVQQTPVSE